ncbi:fumarylacetoacetate hydrolase family protein [Geodermatophilus ruber]|uniref:2-keto-4-pentenoate hydratase/2-oxohepta-3-ene-1,7-dioic acid hydratase (Catechol pathway) n=1 Tax=Geodermatophilus ruber TaxID=504800 RepID=A0A1I4H9W7_9ACTN|nr:fumarylacetoacetate hydrolase family protein [Geodermatophilus ruber]SFL38965.1 2-keto-4-pentenoate hydratase/2-oxohepta-3-ene-1,7-dioic acid hydratase (catechol pathway) [Geodermatophilus ruber]
MKYVSFLGDAGPGVGVVLGDHVFPVPHGYAVSSDGAPMGLLELIQRGTPGSVPCSTTPLPLADVRLLAPIPRPPRNVICVGQNYHQHSLEFDASGYNSTPSNGVPDRPVVFTKAPSSVIGPGEVIPLHDNLTTELDYEAELGVIIGKGGRGIPAEEALSHVWGYTIINDVTARDVQRDHRQWFLGKSLDGACPMGPFAVTADEVDLTDLLVETRINGELRQSAKTADLIFDVPTLIATISAGMTLEPGDVIATGTPAGVGIGFDPPRFLSAGDTVEVSITGLGTLINTVGGPPQTGEGEPA